MNMPIVECSPLEAAKRLAVSQLSNGYVFSALHAYTDVSKNPIYWKIRLEDPKTGAKWIRPMHKISHGEYQIGDPKFDGEKPLYNLHSLLSHSQDTTIVLVEGEKCVDKLTALGLLATTSGATSSINTTDWQPLANRSIIIWPDNDAAGRQYAEDVCRILQDLGCTINLVDISKLGLGEKEDCVDWLIAHPDATASTILQLDVIPQEVYVEDSMESDAGSRNQASTIVQFVKDHTILFHDENDEVYGQDIKTKEVRRLGNQQFRYWLSSSFYEAFSQSLRDQALKEALSTLAGLALHTGECHQVFVRIAQLDDAYFIDLAEPGKSRAIRITPGIWEIIDEPPVRFLRPKGLHPLPEPKINGDLSLLWQFMNIPEEAQLLVMTWLADCLRLDTPFPLLELIGEQGSAKSTTQKILRRLIDPNDCDLRSTPKSVDDLFVSANCGWITSFENVSYLTPALQDALCILSTGGGYAKRKLYTNDDESIINTKRPVILNGINAVITAQDLIDRTISIEMPNIEVRLETITLFKDYEAVQASILGGILHIVAAALELLPGISLTKNQPRLIEFARLGMAVAKVMGKDEQDFLRQFNQSRSGAIARTIDANPVASAIIEWFSDTVHADSIQISMKELLTSLDHYHVRNNEAWPKTEKSLGDSLRRAAPALRCSGIDCKSLGKIGGYVRWEIKACEKLVESCPESPNVLQPA